MQVNETHEKIIEALKNRGPSLPIQLAKDLEMSSLFVSAFLSELAKEKRIKISSLKVGGSPIYFIEGQQEKLEQYQKYLHPKEAEAFLILKDSIFLRSVISIWVPTKRMGLLSEFLFARKARAKT